tara:strand:- start:527 stop:769 length:243 start_codon:yes stop_codon:yes gene_type:complete
MDTRLRITRFQILEYTIWIVSNARPRIAIAGSIVKENRAITIAPTYPIAVAVVLFILNLQWLSPDYTGLFLVMQAMRVSY